MATISTIEGPRLTRLCSAQTEYGRRLVLDDGAWRHAAAGEKAHAVNDRGAYSQNQRLAGRLLLGGVGTVPMIASGSGSAGPVYSAADGKVAAAGHHLEGVAIADYADGDQIEVVPLAGPSVLPLTHTVDSDENTANSATIDTGLGAALAGAIVSVRSSSGVERYGATVTFGTAGNAGKITVADSNLAAADVISILAFLHAAAL